MQGFILLLTISIYLYIKESIFITRIKETKCRKQHCPRCETNYMHIHKREQDSYSAVIIAAGSTGGQDRQTGRMPRHHEPRSRSPSRVRCVVCIFSRGRRGGGARRSTRMYYTCAGTRVDLIWINAVLGSGKLQGEGLTEGIGTGK